MTDFPESPWAPTRDEYLAATGPAGERPHGSSDVGASPEAPKKAKKTGRRRHWKRKAAKPAPDRREEDRQFWRAVFGGEPPERHR